VQVSHANALLAGVAYLERPRIEGASGQREAALKDYEQFLRREDRSSASRRQLVRSVQAEIARLSASK
jgi:hypothetical protein